MEPVSETGYPSQSGIERPSPGFWIENWNITSSEARFSGKKLLEAKIADTNSMDGVFDAGHRVIIECEFNPDDIVTGDIIVYATPYSYVVHPVCEIGNDDTGRYFECWGLNNAKPDSIKIRDNNILGIVVGIIYTKESSN